MISLIVAISKNNVIGLNNKLPWHYSEDLKYFKDTTMNKTVLMGKSTFISIGKPLPKRHNIVVTRDPEFTHPGVEVINDLNAFINAKHDEEVFIIGGKQIYQQTLPFADKLYITYINREYQGDVFFPEVDYSLFEKISQRDSDELSFCVFQRKV